jgi:alkylated DNA repair dioxygenase AlkB
MGESSWLDVGTLPSRLLPDEDEFLELWVLHPEKHSEIVIMGKRTQIPRYQQSYLEDYKFSGVVAKKIPLPKALAPYLKWANSLGYGEFHQYLVNWYEDGNSYIGSHSDDEKQLVPGSPIVTITLCREGTPRKFRIRAKDAKKTVVEDVLTTNGKILVMGGDFQKEFKHEIVKITGAKAADAGARISITLRQFAK